MRPIPNSGDPPDGTLRLLTLESVRATAGDAVQARRDASTAAINLCRVATDPTPCP